MFKNYYQKLFTPNMRTPEENLGHIYKREAKVNLITGKI